MTSSPYILISDASRPIVTLSLNLKVGQLLDPEGQEGLAYLTGQMLMRGTEIRSYSQLNEDLDYLGSSFGIAVGRDRIGFSGDALTRHLEDYESLLGEILTCPTFPSAELEKLRRQLLAEFEAVRDHDPTLGKRQFVKQFYGTHPYGRPLKGTPETLAAIDRDAIQGFFQDHFRAEDLIVGAAGDIDQGRLESFVARTTGGLPQGSTSDYTTRPHQAWADGYHVTLVDKPERSQTQVFIGQPAVDANHADYIPLFLANTIFGGTFTARLSQEIREKRGWSYGAYSYLNADRDMGTFTMRFYPGEADTISALKVTDALYTDFCVNGPTDEEIAAAQRYLINAHPMSIETSEKRLHEQLSGRLVGRPDDWLERCLDEVATLDRETVHAAVKRHLNPNNLVVTIVCTAAHLTKELEEWDKPSTLDIVDYQSL